MAFSATVIHLPHCCSQAFIAHLNPVEVAGQPVKWDAFMPWLDEYIRRETGKYKVYYLGYDAEDMRKVYYPDSSPEDNPLDYLFQQEAAFLKHGWVRLGETHNGGHRSKVQMWFRAIPYVTF